MFGVLYYSYFKIFPISLRSLCFQCKKSVFVNLVVQAEKHKYNVEYPMFSLLIKIAVSATIISIFFIKLDQ